MDFICVLKFVLLGGAASSSSGFVSLDVSLLLRVWEAVAVEMCLFNVDQFSANLMQYSYLFMYFS